MSISKNLEIKINGDKATFNEKFYIYQNDRGIDLYIKINLPKVQIGNKNVSLLSELTDARAGAVVLKPNNTVIGKNAIEIVNDTADKLRGVKLGA